MLKVEQITKIVEGIGKQFNDDILIRFYDRKKNIFACEFIPTEYYDNATPIIEIVQSYKGIQPFGNFIYNRENYKILTIEFELIVATE
jgi:hypothetical protein